MVLKTDISALPAAIHDSFERQREFAKNHGHDADTYVRRQISPEAEAVSVAMAAYFAVHVEPYWGKDNDEETNKAMGAWVYTQAVGISNGVSNLLGRHASFPDKMELTGVIMDSLAQALRDSYLRERDTKSSTSYTPLPMKDVGDA